MKILIIIPAYNEENSIKNVCDTIEEYKKKNKDITINYIVINDGSKDNTLDVLQKNKINHINLIHNLGIGGAVQTGYKYAYNNEYDIAIQMDGDGQHNIDYLMDICNPIINNECDMCIGTRYLDKSKSEFQSTFMRRLGKDIISSVIKLLSKQIISDPTSGFRAINKKIIKEFAYDYPTEYPEPESTLKLLLSNYKVKEIPVSMNERKTGKSSINMWKSIDYMLKVVLALFLEKRKVENKNGS